VRTGSVTIACDPKVNFGRRSPGLGGQYCRPNDTQGVAILYPTKTNYLMDYTRSGRLSLSETICTALDRLATGSVFSKDGALNQFSQAGISSIRSLILESIHHPLRKEEKVVDLTAMLLGFSRLYMTAAHTKDSKLGYLTPSELETAVHILVPTRWRIARSLSIFAQSFPRPLIAIGILFSILVGEKINSKISLHRSLQSEAEILVIPKKLNSHMTLVGAQVGTFSLTKTFEVTQPAWLDLTDREQRVRDSACAKKKANIDAGAVYAYEYREPSGSLIGRFEVSSCP
jgi:hypothetical protein